MKQPCLLLSRNLSLLKSPIVFIATLSLLLIFFSFSTGYAASPINEKIIKYRFFVKTLSIMPELKTDCVLPFELECTYHALKLEVIKASKDYNNALNYIVDNFQSQPQKYAEFLKMLREKLAAEGIFPSQFNELRLDSNDVDETTAVQFLKLRNKILELRDPEPGNSAEAAYQKAVTHMKAGYDFYCQDDYNQSSSEFGLAIEHWQAYYKLHDWGEVDTGFAIAKLRELQGCVLVDGENYENAKIYFDEAIKIWEKIGEPAGVVDVKILKAEIFYRQNLISEFIKAMKEIQYKNDPASNVHSEIDCRRDIIYGEYIKLSSPYFSIMTKQAKESRENYIKAIEKLKNDESHLNKEYIKKFIKRYEKILEYNSFEIVKLSFESNEKYNKLKDHKTKAVIGFNQWEKILKLQENYDSITINKQPVALITGNKLEFFVGIYSLTGTDPTWDLVGRTIINGKEVKFKNRGIISRAENVYIHKFESDEDFTNNQVKVVPLEIEWWLRTFDKNRAKEFSLGKTSHKIYVVRKKVAEPCYWLIVEYTCNWLKNLTESQIKDDEKAVVDAIWAGCSIDNLEKKNYAYVYPSNTELPNSLSELLIQKKSKCGGWQEFFKHCLYCQGIKGTPLNFILIERALNDVYQGSFVFFNNPDYCSKPIGFSNINDFKPKYFSDHAVTGWGGESFDFEAGGFNFNSYKGGYIFDIVFHVSMPNNTMNEYEDNTVEFIKRITDEQLNKKKGVKEFLLRKRMIDKNSDIGKEQNYND